MDGGRSDYEPPRIADLGDLVAVTEGMHLVLGQAGASDLSFSAPSGGGGGDGGGPQPFAGGDGGGSAGQGAGPGGPGTVVDQIPSGNGAGDQPGDAQEVADTADSGGGDGAGSGAGGGGSGGGGSGGGGSGGGGGGNLPFTGFAAGVVAAVGSGFAVAGGALRRALRRHQ